MDYRYLGNSGLKISEISLRMPLPPIGEQRRQGANQLALLGIHDGASAENRRLEPLRDALLPALMSGKIRVKDVDL